MMPVSVGFAAVRGLVRLLLAVFYRRIEVVGSERIPAQGALIIAANHHNSVVDAMLLLAVVPRRLRALAKAQLFGHFLVGPFLRLAGSLPVHRRQEAGDDPRRNDALFAETTRTLRDGGAIMIFPEGRTQPDPVLLELRTGAARMLLAAQPAEVTLLPAGLVFRKPGVFREGEALVVFGEPIPTLTCRELARGDPEAAARELTTQLAQSLRKLIVEANDLETLGHLELAEGVWSHGAGVAQRPGVERLRWLQQAASVYQRIILREPERLQRLVRRLQGFVAELESSGLTLRALAREHSAGRLSGVVARQAFRLLITAPLAICGFLIHGLPYAAVGLAVRLVPHTSEEDATDKIAIGLVFYPLFWCLEGWLLWHLGGATTLLAFAALLVPSGFVALTWRERLARLMRGFRSLARLLREPGLVQRLRAERDELVRELDALAAAAAAMESGGKS